MTTLSIPENIVKEMLEHLRGVWPEEGCGILAGRRLDPTKRDFEVKGIYKVTNADKSNSTYVMDSMEQFKAFKDIEKSRLKMVAIYHSHPHSTAEPSAIDLRLAAFPDVAYVIVSFALETPVINAFSIDEGKVEKIEIIIV